MKGRRELRVLHPVTWPQSPNLYASLIIGVVDVTKEVTHHRVQKKVCGLRDAMPEFYSLS